MSQFKLPLDLERVLLNSGSTTSKFNAIVNVYGDSVARCPKYQAIHWLQKYANSHERLYESYDTIERLQADLDSLKKKLDSTNGLYEAQCKQIIFLNNNYASLQKKTTALEEINSSLEDSKVHLQEGHRKEINALKRTLEKKMIDSSTHMDRGCDDVAIQVSPATTDSENQCSIDLNPQPTTVMVSNSLEENMDCQVFPSEHVVLPEVPSVKKTDVTKSTMKKRKFGKLKKPQRDLILVQCYNCQKFGHYASDCEDPPKCLKCGQEHTTRSCSKHKDDPPCCVNCKLGHTSNYKGCPFYKKLRSTIRKNKDKLKPRKPAVRTVRPKNLIQPEDITAICKSTLQDLLKDFQQQILVTVKELVK